MNPSNALERFRFDVLLHDVSRTHGTHIDTGTQVTFYVNWNDSMKLLRLWSLNELLALRLLVIPTALCQNNTIVKHQAINSTENQIKNLCSAVFIFFRSFVRLFVYLLVSWRVCVCVCEWVDGDKNEGLMMMWHRMKNNHWPSQGPHAIEFAHY